MSNLETAGNPFAEADESPTEDLSGSAFADYNADPFGEITDEAPTEEVSEAKSQEDEPKPEPEEPKAETKEEREPEKAEAKTEDGDADPENEKPAPEEKFTVTIEGKQYKVGKDELIKGYQRGTQSAKKFEEAASMRKQVAQVLEGIKDPRKLPAVLKHLGVDPAHVYNTWRQDLEQWQSLSEGDRLRLDYQQREQQLQAREQALQAQMQEKQAAVARQAQEQRLAAEMHSEIERLNLPKNPQTVGLIADHQLRALDAGYVMSTAEAAEIVKEQLTEIATLAFQGAAPDHLAGLLGEDFLDQVAQARVSKLREQKQAELRATQQESAQKAPARRKKKDIFASEDGFPDEWDVWGF